MKEAGLLARHDSMSTHVASALGLFLLAGCAAAPPPAASLGDVTTPTSAAVLSPPRLLEADTNVQTPAGATFEAPKGWTLASTAHGVRLDGPERDVQISLVELHGEPDPAKAAAAAWKTLAPSGAAWPVRQLTPLPPKDGWDGIAQIHYDAPARAQRTVLAIAKRKGDVHYVFLIDASDAGLDRRGAQVGTVLSTFKAPGVKQESFAGKTAHDLDAARLARLNTFMQHALDSTHVPGAALAVVQHGKVVFEQGYGVATLGRTERVQPDTLFMIGSTTKSLSTLMMAQLVDDQKFDWDTPLAAVLPTFQLADPGVTKRVLMRHTVCACTGMPRRDLDLFFSVGTATPESRLDLMQSMTPSTGFGETFQYSNLMVAAGGYAAAHAALPQQKLGPAYDQTMQARVFAPLGMRSTTLDFAKAAKSKHATPHAVDFQGVYHPMSLDVEKGVVAVRPAGAAWSTVQDMARYVTMELAGGKNAQGTQIVSAKNLLVRRTPQIKITDKMDYGYGLFIERSNDVTLVGHGGNNLGFTSDLFFLPEHDVGVVLLMNGDEYANPLRNAFKREVLEILFDGEAQADNKLQSALRAGRASMATELAKIVATPPAGFADAVLGTFQHPQLGSLRVTRQGDQFVVDAHDWKSVAGVRKDDDGSHALELVAPPLLGLQFVPSREGGKRALSVEMPQQKYTFVER